MLTEYLAAAMRKAHYEIMEDGEFYGEIPGLQGVYANAPTLEGCRDLLAEVLEGWVMLGISLHHDIPEVDGVRLEVPSRA
jgi:predicted RNase H-like HicB family nuclease